MNKHQIKSLKDLIKSYSYCAKNGSLDRLLHISDNSYLFNILNNLESKLIKMEKANDGTANQRNDSQ
jgi:hypothetical protein